MASIRIDNVRVLEPGRGLVGTSLRIVDDRVEAIDPQPTAGDERVIDGRGHLVTPGLIDVHTHGIETCVFERDAQEMRDGLRRLAKYGVTCCLPTLYRVMERDSLDRLAALANAMTEEPIGGGLHLEGPFLALAGAGASTLAGDVGLVRELLAACGGRVAAMSISPETPGIIPVIEHLVEQGVVVFMTHTRASVEQTERAIAAGARHATHFYDVFHVPGPADAGVRPVGAVEAILAEPGVSVDFIADGVHVHPAAIRAALAAKGWAGVIAITDANVGAGLGEGIYPTAWGYDVRVRPEDGARIHRPGSADDGQLAGSALTMNVAVGNVRRWLGGRLEDHQIWAMASANPARLIGLAGRGSLMPGSRADLVVWDDASDPPHPIRTFVAGKTIFEAPDA